MKFRPIKLLTHALCWGPFMYLIYGAFNPRFLGADPQEAMLHILGLWVLIFLLTGLSITPVRKLLGLPRLTQYRRMMGLYAGFYLILHLTVFIIFYMESDIGLLGREILERPYITVGMLAFVLMLPLILTSTKNMQRRLGRNWKKLHQMVYLIATLGVIHFIWQSKSDLNEPLLYLIWLSLLLGLRSYWNRRQSIRSGVFMHTK